MKDSKLNPYEMRFVAEYYELVDRASKLQSMLVKWDLGKLDFTPKCPKSLLEEQSAIMTRYIEILQERADIEGLRLE